MDCQRIARGTANQRMRGAGVLRAGHVSSLSQAVADRPEGSVRTEPSVNEMTGVEDEAERPGRGILTVGMLRGEEMAVVGEFSSWVRWMPRPYGYGREAFAR